MSNIWKLLKIEPTDDIYKIRQAYAVQSKSCNPEDKPQEFMELRRAYQKAMEYAEGQKYQDMEDKEEETEAEECEIEEYEEKEYEAREYEEKSDIKFFFSSGDGGEANPYKESEAYKSFVKLYKKENQKNWKLWMEYITSAKFLEIFREDEFTALLLNTVKENMELFKPGTEFIKALYIAYNFTCSEAIYVNPDGEERRLSFRQGLVPIPQAVIDIAYISMVPKRFEGNDYAMMAAFSDYYHMQYIKENTGWGDEGLHGLRLALEHYTLPNISDRCSNRQMAEQLRHPVSLRLLENFFDSEALTEDCYQLSWDIFDLKNTLMGRNKLLYGRLKEICLDKCPKINYRKRESFRALNAAFMDYGVNISCYSTGPKWEEEETEKLFAREDIELALTDRIYVANNVITYWISHSPSPALLRRLKAFYEEHPTAPRAREIIKRIEAAKEERRILEQNTEDSKAQAQREQITVNYRPFLRYWLNVAFLNRGGLKNYLEEQLPYSHEWADRLLGTAEGEAAKPVYQDITALGQRITVGLHRFYAEYRIDGRERICPFLPYESLKELDNETFFMLLPMALPVEAAEGNKGSNEGLYGESSQRAEYIREAIEGELSQRFEKTALPRENIAKLSEILSAGLVKDNDYDYDEPAYICEETYDTLYRAGWRKSEGYIYIVSGGNIQDLYQEAAGPVFEEAAAIEAGRELLTQIITPPAIDCSCMAKMPETVYLSPVHAPVETISGSDIEADRLNELIKRFEAGELARLEFSFAVNPWELKPQKIEGYERKRSLVFLMQGRYYACMYFDDTKEFFYALRMESLSIGEDSSKFNLLSHKELPSSCCFASFRPIKNNLAKTLTLVSGQNVNMKMAEDMGRLMWEAAWGGVFVADRRIMYNLAKQEIGKFPLNRSYNPVELPIALSDFYCGDESDGYHYAEMEQWGLNGERSKAQIDNNKKNLLKQAVTDLFAGAFTQLRISLKTNPESYRYCFSKAYFEDYLSKSQGKPVYTHIVLRRDKDRYMMLCMQDFCQSAKYYVGDKWTYMDVEGKKYPKDTFFGKTVPAYLVHKDPLDLRNRLDLLLDNISCIYPITGRFAEFADESPVKPRSYEVIRSEFISDAMSH